MKQRISDRAALTTGAVLLVAGVVAGAGMTHAVAEPAKAERAASATMPGKPSTKEIAGLFDGWLAAVRTGDPQKVAARYASDAVLLPTASPKIRTDRAGIVDYFEHFLKRDPDAKKIRTVVNVLDRDSAIDTGLYRFTLDGGKTVVEARYTYEYEKRGGKWLIVNHHSSVVPPAS
ncbi:SgcJ/EcaC family oxidoreductase [Actinomadura rudentiformis]|uniref:SgcJ/EcaC family oxidoreductase n=1 Tax=Actinomadura rudentiformis TaxID=359158 RepID=A0A6H9YPX8_9ACTN|nr:SgcJ/EcaC family oxidoreductase [Actinomadura rudentiformis]KAB2342964.1 SgcJ/EcaC family oxidoreductase [Actinomadura rudentiformis]